MTRSDVQWNNVVMITFAHQDAAKFQNVQINICNCLSPQLERSNTVMQRPLSVQRRVALSLWCLATAIEYCTIAHLFGIGQ